MKCVFKGTDGSLGYKVNHIYELNIERMATGSFLVTCEEFEDSTSHRGACVYNTEKSFLANWMTPRQILAEKVGHPTLRTF